MNTNSNYQDPGATSPLKERIVLPKPEKTIIAGGVLHHVFVLKYREGTHIRTQTGQFFFDIALLSPSEEQLLKRAKLDHDTIKQEVNFVNNLFLNDPDLQFQRMFNRPEVELDKEKLEGEQASGEELADLNLYFYVNAKKTSFDETAKIIDQLNALSVVEIAYPQPIPFPASVDIPPTTGDFTGIQSYLEPAPEGIDAYYAWAFRGGRGANVQLIDIETGWNLDHEDLPSQRSLFHNHGWNWSYHDHGTASIGIIAAQDNRFGITGIVPEVSLGVDSPVAFYPPYDVPGAINRAAAAMRRGGIILIEQHYSFGRDGRWVPVEYSRGDFDAIHTATSRGIIVVEAAGNGGEDLDLPHYQPRFNREIFDSHAILVGAGGPYTGMPQDFSNFGSRVDVQGWGSSVMTLGYSNALIPGSGDDVNQRYTEGFGGTSSASPIVAGAAAAIQGIRIAHGLPVFSSFEMRQLLRTTGTSGAQSTRQIGPLPNLRKAIDSLRIASLPPAGWPAFSDFQTDSPPVIVQGSSGALTCFVIRGSNLWWRTQSEPYHEWSSWLQLGDQPLVGRLAAVVSRDGHLQVFARGRDRAMWYTAQLFPGAGSAWARWETLGGSFSGDPIVAINQDGRLEIFARGTDDQLWSIRQTTTNGPWELVWPGLGGRLASRATMARQRDGRLTTFTRWKDNSVRYQSRDLGGMWSGWQHAGGLTQCEPILGTNADGRLEVFVRGFDGALWHLWERPEGGWSRWESLTGNMARNSAPTVALSPFGNLVVFVRWNDNTVRQIRQIPDPPYWSEWVGFGGNINSDVEVSLHADGRFDLFARAWNGTIVNVSRRF